MMSSDLGLKTSSEESERNGRAGIITIIIKNTIEMLYGICRILCLRRLRLYLRLVFEASVYINIFAILVKL